MFGCLSCQGKQLRGFVIPILENLFSREFLMNYVDKEPLVRETAECRELLLEAMRYHLMPENRSALTSYRTSYRQPDGTKPYLFAIGGGSLFAIHSECEVYNPRTDRWSFIASMNTRRSRTAVATVGNLLYAVGGFDGANDLATAECFNPQVNKVKLSPTLLLLTLSLLSPSGRTSHRWAPRDLAWEPARWTG